MNQLPIICLMGPTASGKTDMAIKLAQQYSLEIISADSALVYKEMDIGTAKPSKEELALTPHRLIDIRDPGVAYSAGEFRHDALKEIAEIHHRGKIPLLVGGTMMYFWVLQNGLADLPPADASIRQQITEKAKEQGWDVMHQELHKVDPAAADRIHAHDTQRIQRALEVYYLTGQPISLWQQNHTVKLSYPMINLILTTEDRQLLQDRIRQRLNLLFQRGFIEEVAELRSKPNIHRDLPSMRSVGYREVWDYLDGKYDRNTLYEKAYIATCQLAKRQITWLRRWPDAERIAGSSIESWIPRTSRWTTKR